MNDLERIINRMQDDALYVLKNIIRHLNTNDLMRFLEQKTHRRITRQAKFNYGSLPTMHAIERMYILRTSKTTCLELLVAADFSLVLNDSTGITALHVLVNIDGRGCAKDKNGWHYFNKGDETRTMFDAIAQCLVAAAELSDNGAPDCRAADGRTPLHWAAMVGHWQVAVPGLLALGADPNAIDDKGSTPLHYAAAGWNLERVQMLVDNKADPTVVNFSGMTAIDEAEVAKSKTRRGKSSVQEIIDYLSSCT